jgi:hypothetical protein
MSGDGVSVTFNIGRPRDIVPIIREIGVEIYSGPSASLAGALPSWSAWFAPGVSYILGSIVFFRGGSSVYQHKETNSNITEREYLNLSVVDRGQYTLVNNARVVDRGLIEFLQSNVRYGDNQNIGDNLQDILGYFPYSRESLYICTKDGANLTVEQMEDDDTRKDLGFHSFAELEADGWITGYNDDLTADGLVGQSGSERTSRNELPIEHDEIVLNLADITAAYVTEQAMNSVQAGYGKPKIIKCKAVMVPSNSSQIKIYSKVDSRRTLAKPAGGEKNYDLGPAEFALVPTDQISFGGGLVRTPNSQLIEHDGEIASGFNYNENVFLETIPHGYLTGQAEGEPFHTVLQDRTEAPIDPRHGRASTSLNAFLASIYKNAYPMTRDTSIGYWANDVEYTEGQVIRYSLNQEDSLKQPVERSQKDFLWICRQTHTSSPDKRPPFTYDNTTTVYWQPYSRLINSPNSSVKELYNLYRDSNAILPLSPSSNTGLGLGPNQIVSTGRRRMSDIIGGSRLYGHFTLSPMGGQTLIYAANGYNCDRTDADGCEGYERHSIPSRLPPIGRAEALEMHNEIHESSTNWAAKVDGTPTPGSGEGYLTYQGQHKSRDREGFDYKYMANLDLWLFPNNFKKDHGGQIKYAISFFDHVDYNIISAFGTEVKKRSWLKRLFFPLYSRKRGQGNWTRNQEFTRSHFQTITKDLEGFQPEHDPLISKNISKGVDPAEEPTQDLTSKSESDIIRYCFRYLTSFHDDAGYPEASNRVGSLLPSSYEGYYEVTIQDLNSGTMIRPTIDFTEMGTLAMPGKDRKDSFGYTWNATMATPAKNIANIERNHSRNQYHYDMWKTYNEEADKIASKFNWADLATGDPDHVYEETITADRSQVKNTSLKLLTTRNWFNWLILGPQSIDVENPQNNYPPLVMNSMELDDFTFNNICGIIQTGFRNVDLRQLDDRDDDGLINFSLPKKLNEAASAGLLPNSVDSFNDGLGAFNVSQGINKMPDDFLNSLKAGSVLYPNDAIPPAKSVKNDKDEYLPGTVVKKDYSDGSTKYFYIQEPTHPDEIE